MKVLQKFKPKDTIHKILISTTSRFRGEFSSKNIAICHAWPRSQSAPATMRMEESPSSRSGFVLAFQTEKREGSILIPDYSPTGDVICSYLAVLFGKRFDSHGLIEGSGFYNIPDLSLYATLCDHTLPFNTHRPREDFRVPLRLENLSSVLDALEVLNKHPGKEDRIRVACKFYMQSLQNAERDVEVAYLHLVAAGEVLSSLFDYDNNTLMDDATKKDFVKIEECLGSDGIKIVNRLGRKLQWVKKRFTSSIVRLLDDKFYVDKMNAFTKANINASIGAAYDLRSKYVHSGTSFGHWIKPNSRFGDVMLGKPVVEDGDFAKILEKAPTYLGLERMIRYCILKYLNQVKPLKFIE